MRKLCEMLLGLAVLFTIFSATPVSASEIKEDDSSVIQDVTEDDMMITDDPDAESSEEVESSVPTDDDILPDDLPTVDEIIDQAVEVETNRELVVKSGGTILETYLKFTLPQDGAVLIDMREDNAGGFPNHYYLYNSSKELVQTQSGLSFSNTVIQEPLLGLEAGTYYMYLDLKSRIYGYSCNVTINFYTSEQYEKELNDSPETANDLRLNSEVIGACRDYRGEKDYYTFNLNKAGEVYIDWAGSIDDDSYRDIAIYDSDNENLLSRTIRSKTGKTVDGDVPISNDKLYLKPGKYYLMVESWGRGTDGYFKYKVSIKYKEAVKVTGISLNRSSGSVLMGSTLTLTANVSPANATVKTVTWSSSNDGVATVTANGLVRGISSGVATVTAKTKDGGKTASCKINVVNPRPAAPTITSVANSEKGITVKWSKGNNVAGYQVFCSKNGGNSTRIATLKGNCFTDTKANTNGARYIYRVYAYTECNGKTYLGYASPAKSYYRLSKTKISSVKNSSTKTLTVKWGKNSKGSGYQIQCSTNKDFGSKKSVTVTSAKTTSKKVSGLKKNKSYYVRIRPYKTVGGTKYYGPWNVYGKKVKVKK